MTLLSKWMFAPIFAAALLWSGAESTAQAGNGFSLSIGGYGGHRGSHQGHYHGGVNNNFRYGSFHSGHFGGHPGRYHSGFGGYHNPGWFHDTSHYDYHPPQVVPHNGHFDYVPGHYDLHRTGHWHH